MFYSAFLFQIQQAIIFRKPMSLLWGIEHFIHPHEGDKKTKNLYLFNNPLY